MGELLFEAILQPIAELIGYGLGFVLVPVVTFGMVRAEWLRSRERGHNWAGVRRRVDGVLILSHNATALWGWLLLIGPAVVLAILLSDPASAAHCAR